MKNRKLFSEDSKATVIITFSASLAQLQRLQYTLSYGIKSMSLCGSYARGEADDDSDVDLLIDKGDLQGLIQKQTKCPFPAAG